MFLSTSTDKYWAKTDSGNERFIENSFAQRRILMQNNNVNIETDPPCGKGSNLLIDHSKIIPNKTFARRFGIYIFT